VVNADGSGLARLTHTAGSGVNVGSPTWSPDGRRMAFGEWEIFVVNADGSGLTNLTKRAGRDVLPAWSPDGRRIAYVSEGRERGLCVMDADGSNDTCLHKGARPDFPPSWSPDGQHIVVASEGYRIWCVSADGSSTIQVTSGPAQCRQGSQRICWDFQPTWSPAKQGIPTPVPLPKPPIEEQLASIAGKYDFIFGWQEEHQSWAWHIPEALGSSLQELQPGKGYFIWMKEAAAMTHGGRSWALLARWNLIGFY
ncbi:MAG TPA: hypothetical protein VJ256_06680, partial [Dehalococcoidia bacterium]|nr:hypothetical protein [Dehalococcoidia bacterium]